jgi:hypothetical protein
VEFVATETAGRSVAVGQIGDKALDGVKHWNLEDVYLEDSHLEDLHLKHLSFRNGLTAALRNIGAHHRPAQSAPLGRMCR